MKHLNIHVRGRVQGVYFRKSTQEKAKEHNICGFIRNEPDGSVYLEAEGTEENLRALVAWCHEGPELANVDQVKITQGSPFGYKGFEIRLD